MMGVGFVASIVSGHCEYSVLLRPALQMRFTITQRRHGAYRACQAAALGAAAILAAAGCYRTGPSATPAPAVSWPAEQHCWWAAYRTTMPPDSVVMGFGRALESMGFSGGRTGSVGDTAWAQAGPSRLGDPHAGTYAARLVAIRMGDTTHLRAFVATDTLDGAKTIPMCG